MYLRMMKRSGLLKEKKIQLEGGLSRFTTIAKLVHKGSARILSGGKCAHKLPFCTRCWEVMNIFK